MANVTPMTENGEVVGYMSVRSKPTQEQISDAEKRYREINASEQPEKYINSSTPLLRKIGKKSIASRFIPVIGIGVVAQVVMAFEAALGLDWYFIMATLSLSIIASFFALNFQLNYFNHMIHSISESLRDIGEGKYFNPIETKRCDGFGVILNELKMTQIKLGFNVINANETILRIISMNSELDQVTSDFQESARSIDESAASIVEINATVKNNALHTENASQLAITAKGKAEQSGQRLKETLSAMTQISEASDRVCQIVDLIDEIAFKTQLLSINASVEAAHAGEQGRGFAVVAMEVRSLAQHATTAATDIKELINDNRTRIQAGQDKVRHADKALNLVIDEVNKMNDLLSEIAYAGKEQTIGVDILATAIQLINESIQKNTLRVSKTTSCSQNLGLQAKEVMRSSGMAVH